MLCSTLISTTDELEQILQLQKQNLRHHVDEAEMKSQGFVTIQHDLNVLRQMHDLAPAVIIKDNDQVVAYALTMLRECRQLIPDLEPMFALLDQQYRGKGLFDELFLHHKKIYQSRFDLFITEIATRNARSIRAHERVGFKTIHVHRDELDEWAVVGWDWN